VLAQKEGFEQTFLGEDCWYAIRISGGMLPKIKYVAAYQTHDQATAGRLSRRLARRASPCFLA
jgi:hypothetical protein